MRRLITSHQGMILLAMQRSSQFLLISAMEGVSASLRRRTTSSNLERDTDLGHPTGKSDSSTDGLMPCLTLVSPMKSAAFESHTGLRLADLLVKNWHLVIM